MHTRTHTHTLLFEHAHELRNQHNVYTSDRLRLTVESWYQGCTPNITGVLWIHIEFCKCRIMRNNIGSRIAFCWARRYYIIGRCQVDSPLRLIHLTNQIMDYTSLNHFGHLEKHTLYMNTGIRFKLHDIQKGIRWSLAETIVGGRGGGYWYYWLYGIV